MAGSGQTLMAVTAQLPRAASTLRPAIPRARPGGRARAATAYGLAVAASLAGRGRSVISGGTEESDVPHAAAGYRYPTVASLNWQG